MVSNYLPPETVGEIFTGLQAGMSLRAVARMAGVSTNTVRRYIPKDALRQCPCGAPAGHKGWCKDRYAKSPARQAFHALRRGVVLEVPKVARRSRVGEARARFDFIFGLSDDWQKRATPLPRDEMYGVIGEADQATRRVPLEVRDDVRQGIILAVYEGRVKRYQISEVVSAFFKYEMKNTIGSMWSLWMSLDTPLIAGGPSFGDLLTDTANLDTDGLWRPRDAPRKLAA